MSWITKLLEWANTGLKTDPGAAKYNSGYVAGEQVVAQEWNYTDNERDKKINQAIEYLPDITYPYVDSQKLVATKAYNVYGSWAHPFDSPNEFATTNDIMDIQTFFYEETAYTAVLDFDNYVRIVDKDNNEYDCSHVLSGDLPSGSGETWEGQCFLTDNTDFYVFFTNTNASPDEHRVMAWTYNAGSWDKKTGWPSTGVAMGTTGDALLYPYAKMIFATDTKMAIFAGWVSVTSSASKLITIMSKTNGSILTEGAGDAPNFIADAGYRALSSDGTNVFFGADQYLASCTIANATTGCGGFGYPRNMDYNPIVDMAQIGKGTIAAVCCPDTYDDYIIVTFDDDFSLLDGIKHGRFFDHVASYSNQYYYIKMPIGCTFDGIKLWIYGCAEIRATPTTIAQVIIPVDVASLLTEWPASSGYVRELQQIVKNILITDRIPVTWATWIGNVDAIVQPSFEGRDIVLRDQLVKTTMRKVRFGTIR